MSHTGPFPFRNQGDRIEDVKDEQLARMRAFARAKRQDIRAPWKPLTDHKAIDPPFSPSFGPGKDV